MIRGTYGHIYTRAMPQLARDLERSQRPLEGPRRPLKPLKGTKTFRHSQKALTEPQHCHSQLCECLQQTSGGGLGLRATFALVRRFERLALSFPSVLMKPIRFKVESSYGMLRAYPLDQEAILICRLSKTKTLLPGDIGTVAALGYEPVNQYGIKIDPKELY